MATDLSPEALAAQARELAAYSGNSMGSLVAERIAAALGAVCDAARAERAAEIAELEREAEEWDTFNRAIRDGSNTMMRAALGPLYSTLWGPQLEALGRAFDTVRAELAERAEEVRQLRGFVQGWLCGNTVIAGDSRKCCPAWERCAFIRQVLAATEPSHG